MIFKEENKGKLKQKVESLLSELEKARRHLDKLKKQVDAHKRDYEKYHEILENIEEGYFEVDITGNFTFFNASMSRILGYSTRKMMGMNNRVIMSPETSKVVFKTFNQVYRTKKQTKAFDWVLIRKDGKEVPIETSVSPIMTDEGEVIGFRGIARDFTKRKQYEETLKESEKKWKELFENSIDAHFIVDLNGNFVLINPEAEKITGYGMDEIIGKNFRDFNEPELAQRIYKTYHRLFVTGEPIRGLRYDMVRKDGAVRAVEGYVNLVRDGKKVVGFHGTLRDITDKISTEAALLASEENYRLLVENAQESITITQDGYIKYMNPKTLELSGYTHEELLSKPFIEFIHQDDRETMMMEHMRKLKGNSYTYLSSFRLLKKDGSIIWFESQGVLITYEGKPAILTFARDISERKKALEELERSEKKYRELFENMRDGWFTVSPEGKIVEANPAFLELLMYSPDELKQYSVFDITPEKWHSREKSIIHDEVERLGYSNTYEKEFIKKDKTHVPVEVRTYLSKDENENVLERWSFVRDITERKRVDEDFRGIYANLIQSEVRYRNVVETSNDAIVVIQDSKIVFFNQNFLDRTGILREEVSKTTFLDFIHPDDHQIAFEFNRKRKEGEDTPSRYEFRAIARDGEMFFADLHIASIDWEGKPAVLCMLRDITESKRAEEIMRESEEKWRNVIETSSDIIFIISLDGKLLDINPAGTEILGYSRGDFITSDIVNPRNKKDLEKLASILGENKFVKDFETHIVKKDGEVINCLLSVSIRKDKEGNIIGFQGFIKDITEKKRLENQLLEIQKMETVGSLAGGIAHNFNNILVGIMGYSEYLLSKKSEKDPDFKAIRTIHEGAVRASELTHQLLNVSRGGEYNLTKIDINNIVKQVLPLILGTFTKSIEIQTSLSDSPIIIEGSRSHLEQCLLNICINARDAMPSGGKLIIETYNQFLDDAFVKFHLNTKVGHYIVLAVTDTGMGILPEVRERIFEPFFTTKEEKRGAGMGLATVYGIVKKHQGFITVYSEIDEGTTIKLYFPSVEGVIRDEKRENETSFHGNGEHILIIDDENTILDIWGGFLREQGFEVLTAKDGDEGIALFREQQQVIKAVIVDFVLPKKSGKETVDELLKINPHCKIIISSGYSENGNVGMVFDMKKYPFIQKPIQLRHLLRIVGETLNVA